MAWEDDHNRRVAQMPHDVRAAHKHSSNHRAEISGSASCGCFYCCATFAPSAIEDWVDEDDAGVGRTALCPRCGIDSVLGDKAGFPLTHAFLELMKSYWF